MTTKPKPKAEQDMAELGRIGGLVGGPARARALSPERRSEISRQAAIARWGTKGKKAKKRRRGRSAP